jgi:hypothetical protein
MKKKPDEPVTQFGAAPEGLHLRLLVAQLLGAPSHAPHLPEATSLVRRLLHSGGVHQMEGALVLVVVVRILAASAELRRILVCTQKHYYFIEKNNPVGKNLLVYFLSWNAAPVQSDIWQRKIKIK